MKRLFFFIIPVIFSVLNLHAHSSFRHITDEDGLSSNHVRSLMQDRFGFVWVGTDQGLNRYDGQSFRIYEFPEEWSGATLLALLEDGPYILLGTDRGVFRFSYENESIGSFAFTEKDDEEPSAEVTSMARDMDGNIWISTRGQGIFRYNSKTEIMKNFSFPDCDGNIASVYVDKSNQVWAVTNWGTPVLSRLNKNKDGFEAFPLHCGGESVTEGGLVLFEDSRQRFWMGTWTSGLYEIDRGTGYVVRHLTSPSHKTGVNHIHSLMENKPGQLAIASDDGLLLYEPDTKETRFYSESVSESLGLSNRFVYPLMKDKEGGLWAGTYYGGVNYQSPFAGQFTGYSRGRFDGNSVGGKVISRFCEDSERNIWMASDDGGLSYFNTKTGVFRNYTSANSGLSYDNVHALCMDGKDLWIGTYTGGVNVLDTRTGKFRQYLPEENDENSLAGTSSYAIFKDIDGNIWVATMEAIHLYDRTGDSFTRMYRTPFHIIDIDQDDDGNIWFSSLGGGILKYDITKKTWKQYRCSDETTALPSDYVNCSLIDSQGNILFGTGAGLCTYDPVEDRFNTVALDESLSNICGIVEDQNVLWITTHHGLLRYGPEGDIQVFSTSDGLRTNQFISNSIFKASDGCIYIGTTNGFNTFYPYQIRTNHAVPDIAFISLTVDNKQIPASDDRVKGYLAGGDVRVELSHHDNSITIQYASLSYCVPEKNQYAYVLEGFDREWNYVGNLTRATYTNLPAGTYVFKVKGTNNDAVWNEVPLEMKIIVHPHPLLSTSFKILYMVLGLLLIMLVIFVVVRYNDKKHEIQMEELKDRKEKEVYESKIKFFTMIAHEIRTPVSLIIGPLENIIRKSSQLPEKVKGDLQTIDRNSQRLLYLVNQLLDFRKVEQDAMVMHFVTQPVIPLLHSVCERFEPTITQNGAEFVVEYPPVDFNVCVDSEALTKLISNLLTNASKYTKDLVRLSCRICPDDKSMFSVTVYDNGCGISPEEQAKIFLPFYQTMENKPGTGIGLSLVKSIAELHGGSISVQSETGRYSSFTATLPISHEVEEAVEEKAETEVEKNTDKLSLADILKNEVVTLHPEYKPVILIVDDNEEIVRFLSDTLSDSYNTLAAYSGLEALDYLESHPDTALIIADWMMPGMDGIELCRQVRANMHTSHIPFILLTARTDDPSKIMGMDCGADVYIEKPFSVEYLEACIKNQVTMRAMLRQRYSSLPLTPLTDVANTNVDNRFLQTMTNLIEAHLSDSNLSVDFLTEQMGISRSSFYNKIKSLTNSTPNELIQLMRLKKAAQLLMEHKYRINEICYMVGFNNPSYFSKCFYKQFGMKPGEFASKANGLSID